MPVNSLSNSSLESLLLNCSDTTTSNVINSTFNIIRVCLLLPLSIFILYLGHRQWRQQRSKTMSHSDMFTYHNAVLELVCNVGTIIYLCGYYLDLSYLQNAGQWIACLIFSGEMSFHLLTCVERYLAVVHPIIYLGLRNVRGVRIRNISIGCAWLMSCVWSCITVVYFFALPFIPVFIILFFSLVVVSFCSVSVLCALTRPGPGEGCGDRERVDQSKQRAFLTIIIITGVLLFWFVGLLVCFALGMSLQLCQSLSWEVMASGFWFMMPSSLVLPLLYLHRTGKLSCCCYNRE